MLRRRAVSGAAVRGGTAGGVANRGAITISIMLANIMQGLDTTIANVALPHIQGSLSASQDQVAWVLTSYIVAAAIMMPLTGWLAGRLGIKYVFIASVVGFTIASAMCGSAMSLTELVLYRFLQGICGAGLIPLAQATLLSINPPERHGHAMAVFGIGAMLGPIMGPVLGGWLTYDYNWRWVFYINVPVGIVSTCGIMAFMRESRTAHREPFDFLGFAALSIAIGAAQMVLDRGELKDWWGSTEIWVETAIAAVAIYVFIIHTVTTTGGSFLNRELMRNPNFVVGIVLMFMVGLVMNGTAALLPTMMEELMKYPVLTTGLVTAPRGIGTMIAMFVVARLINRVDNRLLIVVGFLLAALSMWQMAGFSLGMGMGPIISAGLLQGFGLGCTFVPLNTIALSNLPRRILTQGTALRSLMRNLGGSVGIAILEARLTVNTQIVHSRLVEGLRPDNPLTHTLAAPYSLTNPAGVAALNAEVTRQAAMVAYVDDFLVMMFVLLAAAPLLLLFRMHSERRRAAARSLQPREAD